jgi:hypothetical protein
MNNQPPDRSALEQARMQLDSTRLASARLLAQVSASEADLEKLLRTLPPNDRRIRQARAAHARLVADFAQARSQERTAQMNFVAALTAYLPPDQAEDVARLSAEFPIALLPVRIETRFEPQNLKLKVRIYPDEIFADSHETELTELEIDGGQKFWAAEDGEQRKAVWRELVVVFSAQRAAWIVRATEPGGGTPSATAPTNEPRPSSWNRAVEARLLPDRFLVVAYRNGFEVRRAAGLPVREPLALTHDPQTEPDENITILGDEIPVDDGIAWTLDFDRAVAEGMAVTIDVSPEDLLRGFDELIVVGVKSSLTPQQSSLRLEKLLDAHHYTRGLAFVKQGTPTNNTSGAPSGFPPADPNGEVSFAIEQGEPKATEGKDGRLFTDALGIAAGVADHLANADGEEQRGAREMNNALWPVTMGYYLEQIMTPVFDSQTVSAVRGHFVEHVRGRGPLPAFRVGGVPYGLLPVSSLTLWQHRGHPRGVDFNLPPLLVKLREIWRRQISEVPRIGGGADPDADLLAVLGMDASTQRVRARSVFGWHFYWNLFSLFGIDWTDWFNGQQTIADAVRNTLGYPDINPRALWMTFAEKSEPVGRPLVAFALSEAEKLANNYIQWIRKAPSPQALRDEIQLPGGRRPNALLYFLLRHAALAEYSRVTFGLLLEYDYLRENDRVEPELVKIADGTQGRTTAWQRFDQNIPDLTGDRKLGDYLLAPNTPSVPVNSYRESLMKLEGLTTAELDRLAAETLDICSHRLDAWITSLATKRLREMRQTQAAGVHLGAFGWAEDLRVNPLGRDRQVTLPDGRTARVQASSGGYVHSPSMSHAAAAAILRNGYLTRSGEQRSRYAVDLSSERVRTALYLIDSVRQGQSLGAVLGYRFERGVHEGHRPLELDKYIEPLRNAFPLAADKGGPPSGEPAETIAARNVVDGLALRNAWRARRDPLRGIGLPPIGHPIPITPQERERVAMEEELRRLDETVDAVADLLMAESVHQIVQGNATGAAVTLDSLAGGVVPPDPQIAHAPRSGTTFTHRVGVVLGGDALTASGWPELSSDPLANPRSTAEPYLNGWAGLLLGDPDKVKCKVSYKVGDPAEDKMQDVTLFDLGLQPLDLLALSLDTNLKATDSELDRRVAHHVATAEGQAITEVSISYERVTPADRTFPEVLELAQAVNKVLGGARPLRPEDLRHPAETAEIGDDKRLVGELTLRITATRSALGSAIEALMTALAPFPDDDATGTEAQLDALGEALVTAARFGVAGAFPVNRHGDSATLRAQLVPQGRSVLAELQQRAAQADKAISEADAATDANQKIAKLIEAAQAIFGREFVLLPRFRLANPAELELGFSVILMPANDPDALPANTIRKWLQQAARVRPALGRWRRLFLYVGAFGDYGASLGESASRFGVAQLPHAPGEHWVALPFPAEEQRPQSGRLSLVLHQPAAPAVGDVWVGLSLDEWSETIPHRNETTAVAFHYDDPGAEAPQTVLLAVPPVLTETWDLTTLLTVLRETLDLAKLRAVDGRLLGELGQLLPALYLSANATDEAISTDLSPLLVADPRIASFDLL